MVEIDCEKSIKLDTSPKVTKSNRSLHWSRSISKKNTCAFFITVSVKKLSHYRAGGLLQYRAFYYIIGQLLHYRAFFYYIIGHVLQSSVFYYIIGHVLQYRAFITLSVGTAHIKRYCGRQQTSRLPQQIS